MDICLCLSRGWAELQHHRLECETSQLWRSSSPSNSMESVVSGIPMMPSSQILSCLAIYWWSSTWDFFLLVGFNLVLALYFGLAGSIYERSLNQIWTSSGLPFYPTNVEICITNRQAKKLMLLWGHLASKYLIPLLNLTLICSELFIHQSSW